MSTNVRFEGLRWAWRTVLGNSYGMAIAGAALLVGDILLGFYAFDLVQKADAATYAYSGSYFSPINISYFLVLTVAVMFGLAASFGPSLIQLRRKGAGEAVKVFCIQAAVLILVIAGMLAYVSHQPDIKPTYYGLCPPDGLCNATD